MGVLPPKLSLRVAAAAALVLAYAYAAAADDDPFAAARQQFLLAYAATEAGAPLPAGLDSAALRDYPLYAYLERGRIVHRLAAMPAGSTGAADTEAAAFIAAHAGEPVAADLHRTWLRSLARRSQWRMLVDRYDARLADVELECQWLNARIALAETDGLEPLIVQRWLTGERLPPPCEAPFQWLRDRGAMTDELVEQRVRLLLANGQASFARTVARRLPAAKAEPLLRWAALIEQPQRSIDELIAAPRTPVEDRALADGWRRLARSNPEAALERFRALERSRDLDSRTTSQLALSLALGLAWDRRGQAALETFRDVRDGDFDDAARGWQARAALWTGEWRTAQHAIEEMSESERGHARWRYWLARVAEERGEDEHARELYADVLPSDNFFAANAALKLGRNLSPHPAPLAADEDMLSAIAARPELVRARELKLGGLNALALAEWQAGFAALSPAEREQAIHLASRWDWHDLAVATATRQGVFYDYALLYPRPYDDEIGEAARLAEIATPLLYGLVRQESLFRANAVSSAGAMGLAQLMPDTARIVARELALPAPRASDLLDPAVNVKLGAAHLRSLVDRFDGQTVVALAAYNAGRLAAERWLPEQPLAADIWVENIPYNETREYVQRVLWHSVVFGWLGAGDALPREAWLAPVRPPSAATAAR